VRAGVVLWSTLSGAILGLFVDATLIGVALLFSALRPGVSARLEQRWLAVLAVVALVVIPLASAALGFLEGRRKAT
jgi:hypothetical protein